MLTDGKRAPDLHLIEVGPAGGKRFDHCMRIVRTQARVLTPVYAESIVIAAIVLAAGESQRFGSPKQIAIIDEKPLLQHTIDNLAASRVDDIVVVLGSYADEIQKRIQFGRARVVMNPGYAQGMSTSIHAGLRAIGNADAVMIVLGDQPFVRTSTFDALIATKATVVAPEYNGLRGNPVLLDRSLFAEMMQLRGDVGCRAILAAHQVTNVVVDDEGVVRDVDTPGC
jgi:molybdenum cofactor cytidylyltransferase